MSGCECKLAKNLGHGAQLSIKHEPHQQVMTGSIGRKMALGFLRGYKLIISPWLGPACRFTPTCSEYASDAIERYGVLRGTARAIRRLLSCHPFHRGGWDPA